MVHIQLQKDQLHVRTAPSLMNLLLAIVSYLHQPVSSYKIKIALVCVSLRFYF